MQALPSRLFLFPFFFLSWLAALPKKVFQRWPYMKVIASTVPMEWSHGMPAPRTCLRSWDPETETETETGTETETEVRPHRQNVISLHKVATFDLLGMTGNAGLGVWPRVWDSLLYLFLVSSSDTLPAIKSLDWIAPRRSAPLRFRFHFIPRSGSIHNPQDSFLENLLTTRPLLSQQKQKQEQEQGSSLGDPNSVSIVS